ncbi:uncharacterized protein EHS24_000938 [Apiotrichum porosum]|uniref:Uncharacterized protein n=1 Tax=Apiotrichum porosum TaxID=105984 RepID=A0A427YBG1_9TREE|nr:uncharacterized protein EHS24_000938 [Apiotrichum porosum]RSH88396.1 hypothetical protein EHS24_000938 [Apiotrichum porosum]
MTVNPDDSEHKAAELRPKLVTTLDYSSYPHLFEAIIVFSPIASLLVLKNTCTHVRELAFARLARLRSHIIFSPQSRTYRDGTPLPKSEIRWPTEPEVLDITAPGGWNEKVCFCKINGLQRAYPMALHPQRVRQAAVACQDCFNMSVARPVLFVDLRRPLRHPRDITPKTVSELPRTIVYTITITDPPVTNFCFSPMGFPSRITTSIIFRVVVDNTCPPPQLPANTVVTPALRGVVAIMAEMIRYNITINSGKPASTFTLVGVEDWDPRWYDACAVAGWSETVTVTERREHFLETVLAVRKAKGRKETLGEEALRAELVKLVQFVSVDEYRADIGEEMWALETAI